MKTTLLAIFLAYALLIAGCASNPVKVDLDKAYSSYIGQQRTYSPVTLKTSPGATITISGQIELTLDSTLAPLSVRTQDPAASVQIWNNIERIAKSAMLGYFGYRAMDSLSATRDPVVVEQPEPIIIQPTVPTAP